MIGKEIIEVHLARCCQFVVLDNIMVAEFNTLYIYVFVLVLRGIFLIHCIINCLSPYCTVTGTIVSITLTSSMPLWPPKCCGCWMTPLLHVKKTLVLRHNLTSNTASWSYNHVEWMYSCECLDVLGKRVFDKATQEPIGGLKTRRKWKKKVKGKKGDAEFYLISVWSVECLLCSGTLY